MSRATSQREAIDKAFETAVGPLLPEEVLAAAQSEVPSLGQATVYRAIKRLEEAGDLERVTGTDGRARYELAGDHHHHFQCRECDRVYDVPGCVRSPASLGTRLPKGFRLEGHEIWLSGVCAACA